MKDITLIDRFHDLVYSPDDNGCYIQEYKLDGSGKSRTSPVYPTASAALIALVNKAFDFTDWR